MSISAGFTREQIREFVYEYEIQPYGQKTIWLVAQRVPMTVSVGGGLRCLTAISTGA